MNGLLLKMARFGVNILGSVSGFRIKEGVTDLFVGMFRVFTLF